jgi:hypothetical protein
MSQQKFLVSIYNAGKELAKRELTDEEKKLIIKYYKQSDAETSHLKAIDALEKVFNKTLPKRDGVLLIEKSGHHNDINNKLATMKAEAKKWEQEKRNASNTSNSR